MNSPISYIDIKVKKKKSKYYMLPPPKPTQACLRLTFSAIDTLHTPFPLENLCMLCLYYKCFSQA